MKKDVVVIGLGNPLMSDEGIGIYIIEHFLEHAENFPSVEFIDAGTGGISLLHRLEGYRKAVIIDCAYMGTDPGQIRKFSPDDVRSAKVLPHHSLHEADVLSIIKLSDELGQKPDEIIIFGIEPKKIEPCQKLSDIVSANLDEYITAVSEELCD